MTVVLQLRVYGIGMGTVLRLYGTVRVHCTVTTVVEDIGWGMGRRSLDVGGYGYKFNYPCI